MREAEIHFGTDGWRAIIGEAFTFDNVRRVTAALADFLIQSGAGGQPLVIGYDGRFLGERFAHAAAEVLAAAGFHLLIPERDLPTPVIAFSVVNHGAAGAVMFTASHNPPEYNGLKFIPSFGGPAPAAVTSGIEACLCARGDRDVERLAVADACAAGRIETFDPLPAYRAHLQTLVDFDTIRKAELRVVYDAMHGAGRGILDSLLRDADVQVTALRQTRDPLFGGHPPEPIEAHLHELCAAMQVQQADLGLATDGDADRFGAVDAGGRYLSPNEVIVLIAAHLAEHRGLRHPLVRTVATTHLLDRLGAAYGLDVHETPVGFKHICERMRAEPILIGGEESGGLSIGGHIPEKDGLLADLLLVEARARYGRPLAQVLGDLAARLGPAVSRRIDLPLPVPKKEAFMSTLAGSPPAAIGGLKVEGCRLVDGVKLLLAGGAWALARPSGTEPLLRVYVEASDQPTLEAIAAELQAHVAAAG